MSALRTENDCSGVTILFNADFLDEVEGDIQVLLITVLDPFDSFHSLLRR